MRLTNYLTVISFSGRREAAEGWEDDGSSRDPELEEEFMSRDWPEAAKPLQGSKLKWQQLSNNWNRGEGPYWNSKAADLVVYQIRAKRNLNENWRGDYYTYYFDPVCIWGTQPKKGNPSQRRTETLGGNFKTLAEAQKVCEDHFRDNFGA